MLGYYKLQHRISQKFEPLILISAPIGIFIQIGAVRERLFEDFFIFEHDADFFLKWSEILHFFDLIILSAFDKSGLMSGYVFISFNSSGKNHFASSRPPEGAKF